MINTAQTLLKRVILPCILSALLAVHANAQQGKEQRITGFITGEEDGKPVVGASVLVLRTKKGTTSDDNGIFVVEASIGDMLEISHVNKASKTVKFIDTASLRITLAGKGDVLENVVVTGFQKVDGKKFTGSFATLKAGDIKIDGTVDISRMLEGRASGVTVQNVSGTFGAAPKLRIRGATSITGENKPLWVVDGVVLEDIVNVSNDQLSSGDPSTMLGSAVAGLNINDVESIDILKDAAAAALYGARAMNGVVVITTKKGKSGPPLITYSGSYGVQLKPTYFTYDIMNSADQMSVYAQLERFGFSNYARMVNAPNSGIYGKLANLIQYPNENGEFEVANTTAAKRAWLMQYANVNTNWFDILFRNSLTQDHTISVSGGNEKSQNYFSVSFYNDNGWTIADKVKRYTLNFRNTYKFSDKLSVGFATNASYRDQRAPGTSQRQVDVASGQYFRSFDINPFSYALNTSRVLTAYDQNGELEYFTRNYAPFNIINETRNNSIQLNVLDIRLQGNLTYKITPTLTYDFIGSLRYVKTTQEHMVTENANEAQAYRSARTSVIREANPYLYLDPDHPNDPKQIVLPYGGFYNRQDRDLKNYTFRNMLTWMPNIRKGDQLTILAGQEVKYADRQFANNLGIGYQYNSGGTPFIDPRFVKMMTERNETYYGRSLEFERFVAYFANATYTYQNKYTLMGTIRNDGSNRLGSSKSAKWLPTWTVAGLWNVDKEVFFEKAPSAISHLLLKASYGLNASVGAATNALAVLKNKITNRGNVNMQQNQIYIENLANSELTWEKKYELNLTADIGFFKDRLTVVADYYKRNSFDLISQVKTAGIGGQIWQAANYADLKSGGLDIAVNAKIIKRQKFSWSSTLTFGYNKSEITNTRNLPTAWDLIQEPGGAKQGYPVRGLFSLPFMGLDPYSGVPLYLSEDAKVQNGVNLQSVNTDHLRYEGPLDPTISGGLSNNFSYRNISLNVLIVYQAGNKVRMTPVYKKAYSDLDVMPNELKKRWTLPGDHLLTNIPTISDIFYVADQDIAGVYPYSNYNYSTARVADGGFVRLKSISLSYAFPNSLLRMTKLKSGSVSVVGNNLWLIYSDKQLRGQDPEFFNTGGVAMPINKQITLSLKVGL